MLDLKLLFHMIYKFTNLRIFKNFFCELCDLFNVLLLYFVHITERKKFYFNKKKIIARLTLF